MPANVLGGYRPMYRPLKIGPEKTLAEIRNRVASGRPFDDPDAGKLPDPAIPGIGYDRPESVEANHIVVPPIPDDLSIPGFLLCA
jgi:hypothetical protein